MDFGDNRIPAPGEIPPEDGAEQNSQSTDEIPAPAPKVMDFVVSGLVVSLVALTVTFWLSEEEFLFLGLLPVSPEIVTLCNAGAIAVIMFLRTVLPSLFKATAPYLSYSDTEEDGFQFGLCKLAEFLDQSDGDTTEAATETEGEEEEEVEDGKKKAKLNKTTLWKEMVVILKAVENVNKLALRAIQGLPTIAHVVLVSTLTSLLAFTVGCASVSLPRWSKGLPLMAVLYGLIICRFREEIHTYIACIPTENTVLLLLLVAVGLLVVGCQAAATVVCLVLLAVTPPLLASSVLPAQVRLPAGWHMYLLVLVALLLSMFPDIELIVIGSSMRSWVLKAAGFVLVRRFVVPQVLSDQSQRLVLVVLSVFLTACFYYRGLVFIVERLPPPLPHTSYYSSGGGGGVCGIPTPVLNMSCHTLCDATSTSFFNSAAVYAEDSSSSSSYSYLVDTYRSNHYAVIGLTTPTTPSQMMPEMNFTGVVAFNNRTKDVAIVIHSIALKSGLAANYYNFHKYYHKAVRGWHHKQVHYIFGMLDAQVSSVTVVARAEHGIMAQVIAQDIHEQIQLFQYYDDDYYHHGAGSTSCCVRTQLICNSSSSSSSKVCIGSGGIGSGGIGGGGGGGGSMAVDESIAEFERSVLVTQPPSQKTKKTAKGTQRSEFYARQISQKLTTSTTTSSSSTDGSLVEQVSEHIVFGEIAVFVDDAIESSASVAYRENLFTCPQTFEAIVESFFPGYEYWNELRGFAAEQHGNPVQGIVLFHAEKGRVLIALRSALEEELPLADGGLHHLEQWNATDDDDDDEGIRVSRLLLQHYRRTGIQMDYPQRSLRAACRAVLHKISQLDLLLPLPGQHITVTVTGHSTGAAMAVVVALDLAEYIAAYKSDYYAAINAVEVVSFALPAVVGNRALAKKLQQLGVSHIHYYNGLEDDIVVRSSPHLGFDVQMNQVARPLLMDPAAKRPGAAHVLDVILFNMARSANISRRLHSQQFDPIESYAPAGQCEAFRKYVFDVFCEDYEAARGKKCDSRAALSLDGANDFKFFLEEHVTTHLQKMFCDASDGVCSEFVTQSLDNLDNLESAYDVIVKSAEILAAQKFFDDDVTLLFKALGFYYKFKLFF